MEGQQDDPGKLEPKTQESESSSEQQTASETTSTTSASAFDVPPRQSTSSSSTAAPLEQQQPPSNNGGDVTNYEELAFIGSGTFGSVYKARDRRVHGQDKIVALKKVKIPTSSARGVPVQVLREVSLLRGLESFDHPNIVKLLDVCHGWSEQENVMYLYLIFEHVEQDLSDYLENCPSPGLSPQRIREIIFLILSGVDFLHTNRIVHRDLKPQNVLVAANGQVKLADFGLARIYEQSQALTSVVVTLWYRAPEILLMTSYASPVDIWSSGCIFAELFTRKPLFRGTSEIDQLQQIFSIIGSPDRSDWPSDHLIPYRTISGLVKRPFPDVIDSPILDSDSVDLLEQMLMFNSSKRISASDALRHRYFQEYSVYPSSHAPPESSSLPSSSTSITPTSSQITTIPFPRVKRKREESLPKETTSTSQSATSVESSSSPKPSSSSSTSHQSIREEAPSTSREPLPSTSGMQLQQQPSTSSSSPSKKRRRRGRRRH